MTEDWLAAGSEEKTAPAIHTPSHCKREGVRAQLSQGRDPAPSAHCGRLAEPPPQRGDPTSRVWDLIEWKAAARLGQEPSITRGTVYRQKRKSAWSDSSGTVTPAGNNSDGRWGEACGFDSF